jgi:hypothetical protein
VVEQELPPVWADPKLGHIAGAPGKGVDENAIAAVQLPDVENIIAAGGNQASIRAELDGSHCPLVRGAVFVIVGAEPGKSSSLNNVPNADAAIFSRRGAPASVVAD